MHLAHIQDHNDDDINVATHKAISETLSAMTPQFSTRSAIEFTDALLARGYVVMPVTAVGNNIFAEGWFDDKEAA